MKFYSDTDKQWIERLKAAGISKYEIERYKSIVRYLVLEEQRSAIGGNDKHTYVVSNASMAMLKHIDGPFKNYHDVQEIRIDASIANNICRSLKPTGQTRQSTECPYPLNILNYAQMQLKCVLLENGQINKYALDTNRVSIRIERLLKDARDQGFNGMTSSYKYYKTNVFLLKLPHQLRHIKLVNNRVADVYAPGLGYNLVAVDMAYRLIADESGIVNIAICRRDENGIPVPVEQLFMWNSQGIVMILPMLLRPEGLHLVRNGVVCQINNYMTSWNYY